MKPPSCHLLLLVAVIVTMGSGAQRPAGPLTFEDRVRAQEAIERVYHAHRTGASVPFEQAVPRQVLERKVRRYLGLSAALEDLWSTPVGEEALARELERIAARTWFPDRLLAIYAALDNDPVLIRETLARASLVERLARSFHAGDARLHPTEGRHAPAPLDPKAVHAGPAGSGPDTARERAFEEWWEEARLRFTEPAMATTSGGAGDLPTPVGRGLPSVQGATGPSSPAPLEAAQACILQDTWARGRGYGPPPARSGHSAVWTGAEMIIWGGESSGAGSTGGRYDPLLDAWSVTSITGAPSPRGGHTTVWTGREMIVWGGGGGGTPSDTGGRYDPVTDTWRATSVLNVPARRRSHTAVWTGSEMIVWGGWPHTNTGGRYDPITDTWRATSLQDAPDPRMEHVAVWTGSEMIVWGGGSFITGGRYDPATDTWRATSTTGAPRPRFVPSAVWTGDEMIVWGGVGGGFLPTGGRYAPATDTWSPTSLVNAPLNRYRHSAIWTGARMIVWGGVDFSHSPPNLPLNSGGLYDPATDSWAPTSLTNAPSPRAGHSGVWTGSHMIVWGGSGAVTGGRYDATSDSWTPTSTDMPVPSPRQGHTAVWTGSEMIVWGGGFGPSPPGAIWDPLMDVWRPTSLAGAPQARASHTAIWTGSEMIVWGGSGYEPRGAVLSDGGRYDPAADAWRPMSTLGAPGRHSYHTAVWSGSEMIVWGGYPSGPPGADRSDGARYEPGSDVWRPVSAINAPSTRAWHTVVWTGSEMIVWGGWTGPQPTASGARYDPVTDSWRPTSSNGAPSARSHHTAVWTGDEMIVWGGFGSYILETGARYDPDSDTWKPTSMTDTPSRRLGHTAVWTGREMIVWGGQQDYGILYAVSLDSGGRYEPAGDTWSPTTRLNVPRGRHEHTAVWTGSAMVPWGGAWFAGDIEFYVEESRVSWYGAERPTPPPDSDSDGYTVCDGDCADADAATHPGAADLPGDARDEDCSGAPACDPSAGWRNHGDLVRCVTSECGRLVAAGVASREACERIIGEASRREGRALGQSSRR